MCVNTQESLNESNSKSSPTSQPVTRLASTDTIQGNRDARVCVILTIGSIVSGAYWLRIRF